MIVLRTCFIMVLLAIIQTGCEPEHPESGAFKIVVIGNNVPDSYPLPLTQIPPTLPQEDAKGRAIWTAALDVYDSEEEQQWQRVREDVELFGIDDRGDPAYARAVALHLAQDPYVLAVIGTTASATTTAIARILDDADIPVLMPVATSPVAMIDEGGDPLNHAVRLPPSDHRVQAPAVAGFARRVLQGSKVSLVVDRYETDATSAYSETLCNEIERHLQRMGASVESFDLDSKSDEAERAATQIRERRSDVVVACTYSRTAQALVNGIAEYYRRNGYASPSLVLTDGALFPALDPDSLDVYLSFPLPPHSELSDDVPGVEGLREILEQSKSLSYEVFAFDAMRMVGYAVRECRPRGISRTCVAEQVRQLNNFAGAVSTYSFEGGENTESEYYIYKLEPASRRPEFGQLSLVIRVTKDSVAAYSSTSTTF